MAVKKNGRVWKIFRARPFFLFFLVQLLVAIKIIFKKFHLQGRIFPFIMDVG